jgi:hypothetical protein
MSAEVIHVCCPRDWFRDLVATMDATLQMPETHLLQRVAIPDSPEFVVELGGLRFRGYFTCLEVFNTMTRAHVLLPATSLDKLSFLAQLVDQDGNISGLLGGNASSDGLMSQQTFVLEPVSSPAKRVTLRMCDINSKKLGPSESIYDYEYKDVASVKL